MNSPDKNYVYHGSRDVFEAVIPKRQVRKRVGEDGQAKTIFDDISFHATPYKWIALAYTFNPKRYEIDGKIAHYGMGISLYDHTEDIEIYGFESLDASLEKLYGDGGYLYTYDNHDFFHTEGLGNLEVITKKSVMPLKAEHITHPVDELKALGISFIYIDLARPENEKWRDYLPPEKYLTS